MTNTKGPLESLTATAEEFTKQTQGAMQVYLSWFSWLQKTMAAPPWGSTDLNKKLLSYATENFTATVAFVQKLSQAKNLEDVVKVQTELIEKQLALFNEQTETIGEIAKKAADEMKTPFGMST
jgi:hypothetical protein